MAWFTEADAETPLVRVLVALGVTLFFLLVQRLSRAIVRRAKRGLATRASRLRPLTIQRQEILSAQDLSQILSGLITGVGWFVFALLAILYLNIVFSLFTWTQSLAFWFLATLTEALQSVSTDIVSYLPSLVLVVVIVFVAYLFLRLAKLVFDGLGQGRITLPQFYPEWAGTTFNLLQVLVIALTLVVIFPYLPGSGSPAFQGVSIFVGVLLSLGSTSAVANVVAGVVITYTRAFQNGDRVRIEHTEGEVIKRGTFTTLVRTPKNVDVSIPNATVLSGPIINYSSQARADGVLLHTTVTIGYDVNWRTVHSCLIQAAGDTDGIDPTPEPFVLQTSLNDFHVSYELNAATRAPLRMTAIYSDLHANILDHFREAGVEITSPHYRLVREETPMREPSSEKGPDHQDDQR